MNITVGKIKSIVNNEYVILGIDKREYYYYNLNNDSKLSVEDLVAFRGERYDEFNKAYFVKKVNNLTPEECSSIKKLMK